MLLGQSQFLTQNPFFQKDKARTNPFLMRGDQIDVTVRTEKPTLLFPTRVLLLLFNSNNRNPLNVTVL